MKSTVPKIVMAGRGVKLLFGHDGGFAGHYHVETHGKSAEQIVADVNALADYHAAKSSRIHDAEPLLGTALVVGGTTYTWTCITVIERGTDCELYVNVIAANGVRPKSMPLSVVRRSVAELPTNNELTTLVESAILAEQASDAAEAAKLATVTALLGAGG